MQWLDLICLRPTKDQPFAVCGRLFQIRWNIYMSEGMVGESERLCYDRVKALGIHRDSGRVQKRWNHPEQQEPSSLCVCVSVWECGSPQLQPFYPSFGTNRPALPPSPPLLPGELIKGDIITVVAADMMATLSCKTLRARPYLVPHTHHELEHSLS